MFIPSSAPGFSPPRPMRIDKGEVLRLVTHGHTNREIAGKLYISVRTAEAHRAHIMQKLNLSSRAELVRYGLAHVGPEE